MRREEIENEIKDAKFESSDYVMNFFGFMPDWLVETFQILRLEKDSIFIRENQDAELVYVLLKGSVKATDYRVFGITYDFMRFHPMSTFGCMEILLSLKTYKTTLITVTDCTMLVTSRSNFEAWLKENQKAYILESNMMVSQLLEQGRMERIFLFIQGTDRLMYLLMQLYEESLVEGNLWTIPIKRQQMSDYTGLSIRTINRGIKKLEAEKYITKHGSKISITKEQLIRMKSYIMEKID